jgi:hypothetical protein
MKREIIELNTETLGDPNGILQSTMTVNSIVEDETGLKLNEQRWDFEILGIFSPPDMEQFDDKLPMSQALLGTIKPGSIITTEEFDILDGIYTEQKARQKRITAEMSDLSTKIVSLDWQNNLPSSVNREIAFGVASDNFSDDTSIYNGIRQVRQYSNQVIQAKIQGQSEPSGETKIQNLKNAVAQKKQEINVSLAANESVLEDCFMKAMDELVQSDCDVSEYDLPSQFFKELTVYKTKSSSENVKVVVKPSSDGLLGVQMCSAFPGRFSDDSIPIKSESYTSASFVNYEILADLLQEHARIDKLFESTVDPDNWTWINYDQRSISPSDESKYIDLLLFKGTIEVSDDDEESKTGTYVINTDQGGMIEMDEVLNKNNFPQGYPPEVQGEII